MYKDIPHHCHYEGGYNESTAVRIYSLGEDDQTGVLLDANDAELHTRSLDVGYMNHTRPFLDNSMMQTQYKKIAIFVFRGTNRKQKSVLHSSNTYGIHCGNKESTFLSSETMYSGGFRDMLLNEYPKNRDFSFLKRAESVAISRNFAVQMMAKELKLFFNSHEIGTKKHSDNYFSLYDGYDHSIMVMRLAALNMPV